MITISDKGAERVKEFLEKRGSGFGLRISISTTGCSGYAYQLEFADTINIDDKEFYSNGVKIVVDEKSLIFIDGTEVDYGESFTVQESRMDLTFITAELLNDISWIDGIIYICLGLSTYAMARYINKKI